MVIKVLKSKNDQLRRGDEVVISQLRSPACPVELLKSRVTSHSHMRPAQFFASLCTPRVGSRQSSQNKLIWFTLLCYCCEVETKYGISND